MKQARDIKPWEIDAAKNFIRQPLTELFKAWTTLRDRDNVTMTIHELGHLMAWYAAVCAERATIKDGSLKLDPPLPGPSNKERLFLSAPLGDEVKNA